MKKNRTNLAVKMLATLSCGVGLVVCAERAGAAEGRKIHFKVDFALPTSETDSTPLPGTLKPGWTPFVTTRWRDMYMHDGVWEDGSTCGGNPPKTKGIAGSGVHVAIDCARGGNGGFAVFGMERDNLGGGGEPKGEPQKQKTRKRLDQPSKMPPMTGVRAMPLSVEKGGTGKGVTSIKEAKDCETSD